ncbi:hypothetical protein QAD02_001758 [Eretmocerus hayati]|uniref:Uncharacterized protein n=1 Tax=Eretmocerus hayati TaxID=131215 RepID=A0ACC2NHA6_9HYME|nr:hypothetical protein QAD02_001758 [Eretmocerus hayati]
MPKKPSSAEKALVQTPIHILNNDCLIHIFEMLTIKDRLNLELVCKRWLSVSILLWKSVHVLDVTDDEMEFQTIKGNRTKINIHLCEKVLRRSAKYLTVVNLTGTKKNENKNLMSEWHRCAFPHYEVYKNVHSLIKSLLLNCKNLEELYVCNCIIRVDDVYLSELLEKNQKIRKLKLIGLELKRQDVLSNLSLKCLEYVVLDCKMEVSNFYGKIHESKKLHTLGLKCNHIDMKQFKSNLPNTLRQLSLYQDCHDIDLKHSIENNQLMNLRVLILDDCHIMENNGLNVIRNHCKELLAVRLRNCHWVSDSEVSCISSLPKLICLDISDNDLSDEALVNLSKNIRVLAAGGNDFTEDMLSSILERSHDLEKLDISYCDVSRHFIKLAIKMIKIRNSNVPLEIGMYQTRVRAQTLTPDLLKITVDQELVINFDQYLNGLF